MKKSNKVGIIISEDHNYHESVKNGALFSLFIKEEFRRSLQWALLSKKE